MSDRKYRIRNNRWQTACMEGFEILPDDAVRTYTQGENGENVHFHTIFLAPIDSATEDSEWGRISLKAKHGGDTAFYIYALAMDSIPEENGFSGRSAREYFSDPSVDRAEKLRVLREEGCIRSVNHTDILLYSLRGRYLFLAVDVIGDGIAELSDMCVFAQGDNFMQTFPEVYRERDSFFHRWMSVFSSLYNDLQEEIDTLPKLLNIDTCPAELLPVYASWLGIDITGDFLSEEICRDLVREGYQLSRRKGTKWALERIIEIVLGCKADVVEHNKLRGYLLSDDAQIPERMRSGGVQDVTVLIHGKIQETTRHQLMFLLEQFIPVRARLHLVQLEQNATMDGNAYLDMNAAIPEGSSPVLDDDLAMGHILTLK